MAEAWRKRVCRSSIVAVLGVLANAAAAASNLVPVAPGEALHVVDHGAGTPVVLLPGSLGTAFGFRRLQQPLADAGFRFLAVEPLGLGDSLRPPLADYSLTAQADRVRALLDELGLDRAIVVGQGLGVSIALRLAVRHPERVLAVRRDRRRTRGVGLRGHAAPRAQVRAAAEALRRARAGSAPTSASASSRTPRTPRG